MTPLFFIQNIGLGAGLAMDACAVSMSNGLKEPKISIGKLLLIAGFFGFFQAAMPIIGYFAGHALIDYIGVAIPWIALVLLTVLGGKMIFEGIRETLDAKKQIPNTENADSTQDIGASTETENAYAQTNADSADTPIKEEPPVQTITDCADAPTDGGEASVNALPDGADTDGAENGAGAAVKIEDDKKQYKKLTLFALFIQAIATSIDALSVGITIADYTVIMALVAATIIAAVTFCICVPAVFIGKKFGDRLGSKAVILGGVILVAIGLEICLTGVL